MKKLNLTWTVLLFSILCGMAQGTPRGFNFQAVARNDDGSPKANSSIYIRFGVFPNETSTLPLYKETHTVTTDQFGVFSATVGNGVPDYGVFDDIHFENDDCQLAVWQMDEGVEVLITRTRLLSVPYAKTALHADYASQAFFPSGMVIPFAGPADKVPVGWMLCDGRPLLITEYQSLYNAIGKAWGSVDEYHFNIPDMQGVFLRGVSGTTSRDPNKADRIFLNPGGNIGNNVGSLQADEFHSHTHSFLISDESWPDGASDQKDNWEWNNNFPKNETITTSSAGGNETRPVNVYVNYIIKL